MTKGNILCGSQNPGKTQSLRYIDGKEQPNYPVPAVILHVYWPTQDECGSIWEYTRFHCEPYEVTYNKRVMVLQNGRQT